MAGNLMHPYSNGNHPPALHIPPRGAISPPKSTPLTATPTNGVRKHSPDTEMHSGQKPSKRSRRAINCAPCRASKLKCDRARPCSGCVLRGTTNQCYTSEDGDSRPEDYRNDPHNGIAQIRQGLAVIEAYFNRHGSLPPGGLPQANGHRDSPPRTYGVKRDSDGEVVPPASTNGPSGLPGASAEIMPDPDKGGLYVGPTSASALFNFRNAPKRDLDQDMPMEEQGAACTLDPMSNLDLLSMLPDVTVADRLIQHFFENCTWVHAYIHPNFFLPSWERFKSSTCTDHILLATIFIVLALAVLYLPPNHALLAQLNSQQTPSQLASNYYTSSYNALNRHRLGSEMASPSLELIEYLLLRTQYLAICKDDCEDVWHIRGEVLSYATALGLHRDPGRWRLNPETVERRRWAWWNVVALERWQAFLVGRPLAIANHHFDTLLPDGTDAFDSPPNNSGLHATHCQFFRLCVILGEILDCALSVKKVPHEKIMQLDRSLLRWADGLPPECRTDPAPLGMLLISAHPNDRRLAIQTLHLNSAMYHIQFTLHRPYTVPVSSARNAPPPCTPEALKSFDRAVQAADRLINYVCGTLEKADSESKTHMGGVASPLTVQGHLGWGPYHIFHAAMYYSFQLIWQSSAAYSEEREDKASIFRSDIRRSILTLERLQAQGIRIAQKALSILRALAPLYEEICVDNFEGECELKMSAQLEFVRRLAFPWQHTTSSPPSTVLPMPSMSQAHPSSSPTAMTNGGGPHSSSPGMPYTPNGIDGAYAAAAGLMGPAQGGPPMAYNMQGDEGVWSASLALDSDQWNRFLERVPNGNQVNGGVPQNGGNAVGINGVVMV